jgi:ribosomal protein L11 methyltransferase
VTHPFWAAAVSVDPAAADAVSNFLWEAGAAGVVEEPADGVTRLVAFFPPGTAVAALRERVADYLAAVRALAVAVGPATVELTPVADQAWADAWRDHFRPIVVGRRLLVCPPWEVPAATRTAPPPDARRTVIVIEPGRAFGTGGHATTRGCLELAERALAALPVERVLDVGTGSGILAIAAVQLGASHALALDLDPDAVRAARDNADRNGVGDRVRVELGSLEAWDGADHDLILANLLGPALVTLAPAFGRVAAARARLVLGGLLVHEVSPVVGAFAPQGFGPGEVLELDGWASLLLARDETRGP